MSELKKSLLAKADEAEAAYKKGYELLDQYRFQEAIPYLQQAVSAVRMPDFYLTLGRAYDELPDPAQAERVLREGLTLVEGKNDDQHEAQLANQLGVTLQHKGDLDGALSYAQRALKIDEKVYGPDHPSEVLAACNRCDEAEQHYRRAACPSCWEHMRWTARLDSVQLGCAARYSYSEPQN
jgi:tetratricopeptide (TPR) repeat protein